MVENKPEQRYDAIYLSPHLDDVALSCGGQIASRTQAGQTILIVTITAGTPQKLSSFAQSQHEGWQLGQTAVVQRKLEDEAACAILGADSLHWDFLDCIYRRHPMTGKTLYNADDDIFGLLHPAEWSLVEQLAQQIATLPPHNQLLAPLTVGNHVDHQLTRLAAEVVAKPHLVYYEDYPYAQVPHNVVKALGTQSTTWQSQVIPVSTGALMAKIEAISAFSSQLNTLFNGRSAMIKQLHAYTNHIGGERLWLNP